MIDKYLESLSGITYPEWIRLRTGLDREFDRQKGESERQLKFADTEAVKNLIQSQFGRT